MERVIEKAHARAGLLGNPSDAYEGKAIALCVRNFAATVTLEPAERFAILPAADDALSFPDFRGLTRLVTERGCYGGMRLLRAAVHRFALHWPEIGALAADDPRLRFTLSYRTDIPRQVGLGGSSAIVMATLRALLAWFGQRISAHALAELTLAAEVEDLGILAGPMDRVIQAYEGVLHMDFAPPRTPASYRALDAALLPPLFLAWDPRGGEVSGRLHNDVRQRWLAGDTRVRRAIARFPGLVDTGLACLEAGDLEGFCETVDANFDTRASIWTLSDRDRELVGIGRAHGAAVKFCGSGGAVIGVLRDVGHFAEIQRAYAAAGYAALRSEIAPARETPHALAS